MNDDWIDIEELTLRREVQRRRKLIREGRIKELAPDFSDDSETKATIDDVLKSWTGRDANE